MYAVKAKIPVHTLIHVCHKFTLYEGIHDQTVLCLKSYLLSLKTYMYSLLFDSSSIFITLVRLRCWIPDAGRRLHQLCPWMGHLMLSLAVCSVVASSCYNSDRKGLLRDTDALVNKLLQGHDVNQVCVVGRAFSERISLQRCSLLECFFPECDIVSTHFKVLFHCSSHFVALCTGLARCDLCCQF